MLHSRDPQAARGIRAVRDGQQAAVTCSSCGCRLETASGAGAEAWFHFGRMNGRDARGCRTACIDAPHDTAGRAILAA
jgi:hypothetical protein